MARKKAPPTAREAFLRAICEESDEDAHRLVYADWLDDHGDPDRAEFIRVQCALAKLRPYEPCWLAHPKLGPYDPRRPELMAREQALLDKNMRAWLGEVPEWARVWVLFHRGFLSRITLTARQWLRSAAAVLPHAALEEIALLRCDGATGLVARSPHLARVAYLGLHGVPPAEVGELAAATDLRRLAGLRLGFSHGGDEGVAGLVRLPLAARLKRLSLDFERLSDAAAAEIAAAPALAGLEELELPYNPIGTPGVAALASSPHLARLRRLDLTDTHVPVEGVRRLAESRALPALSELLLPSAVGDAALAVLAASPLIERLTFLNMDGHQVGSGDLEALAATTRPTRLEELSLAGSAVGDRGAAALARSPVAATLRVLNLDVADVGPEGVLALASSPFLTNLEVLRVDGHPLSDEGAFALARSPHLPRLRLLNARKAGLSEPALRALRERFGRF
jgi:uncharacterized protein (TIGR02996 family)